MQRIPQEPEDVRSLPVLAFALLVAVVGGYVCRHHPSSELLTSAVMAAAHLTITLALCAMTLHDYRIVSPEDVANFNAMEQNLRTVASRALLTAGLAGASGVLGACDAYGLSVVTGALAFFGFGATLFRYLQGPPQRRLPDQSR